MPATPFTTATVDQESTGACWGNEEALARLHEALVEGSHWFSAVLEAIALWRSPEEQVGDRHYRYLVGGEAFDWLLLAERLTEEIEDVIPEAELEALLFFNKFPVDVGPWEFQRLIGRTKYRAYLNYWYGILVEEALQLAVEERITKDRRSIGFLARSRDLETAYQWVYGIGEQALLERFREERGLAVASDFSLELWREFTYWCFKYRLLHRDPAKVASDTRLGLEQLQRMRSRGRRLVTPGGAASLFTQ